MRLKLITLFSVIFCWFLPNSALAVSLQNFNTTHYQQCISTWETCPKEGAFYSSACVTHLVKKLPVCAQVKTLAQRLDMPANSLSVKKVAMFNVVTEYYAADGQEEYYILTPQGQLIKTLLDPRLLHSYLMDKYPDQTFMVTSSGFPEYHTYSDKTQAFLVPIRITKECIACELIGTAQLQFNFSADGRFIDHRVLGFTPANNNQAVNSSS